MLLIDHVRVDMSSGAWQKPFLQLMHVPLQASLLSHFATSINRRFCCSFFLFQMEAPMC